MNILRLADCSIPKDVLTPEIGDHVERIRILEIARTPHFYRSFHLIAVPERHLLVALENNGNPDTSPARQLHGELFATGREHGRVHDAARKQHRFAIVSVELRVSGIPMEQFRADSDEQTECDGGDEPPDTDPRGHTGQDQDQNRQGKRQREVALAEEKESVRAGFQPTARRPAPAEARAGSPPTKCPNQASLSTKKLLDWMMLTLLLTGLGSDLHTKGNLIYPTPSFRDRKQEIVEDRGSLAWLPRPDFFVI